ncbi:MAG TPA: hypothetical protein EYO73_00695, partial [Sulfurimonas sp.]|nr:hypothetical protein [Sulfurimonas sp.]
MVVSIIDWKKAYIPNRIIFSALFVLGIMKYIEGDLHWHDLVAVLIILSIFLIPIALNMDFGGGDLRYGAFCALFLGLPLIGWFLII